MVFMPLENACRGAGCSGGQSLGGNWGVVGTNQQSGHNFLSISNQLAETKHARDVFDDARQKAAARIELARPPRPGQRTFSTGGFRE